MTQEFDLDQYSVSHGGIGDAVKDKWEPVAKGDLELSLVLEHTNDNLKSNFSLRDTKVAKDREMSHFGITLLPAIAWFWQDFKATSYHMFNVQPMGAPVAYAYIFSEAKAKEDDKYALEKQIVEAKVVPLFFSKPDCDPADNFWSPHIEGAQRMLDSKLVSVSKQSGYMTEKNLTELLQGTTSTGTTKDINRILCSPLLEDFIESVPYKTALIGYSDSLVKKEFILSSSKNERTQGLAWCPYTFNINFDLAEELQVRGRWAWAENALDEYPYHMHTLID